MIILMKGIIWANLFNITIIGGLTHNVGLLFVAIIGAYVSLRLWPVFKDKPDSEENT